MPTVQDRQGDREFADTGMEGRQGMNRYPKIDFPSFYGSNPRSWIQKCENQREPQSGSVLWLSNSQRVNQLEGNDVNWRERNSANPIFTPTPLQHREISYFRHFFPVGGIKPGSLHHQDSSWDGWCEDDGVLEQSGSNTGVNKQLAEHLQDQDLSWEDMCEDDYADFEGGYNTDVLEQSNSFSREALQQPATGNNGEDHSKVNSTPLDDSLGRGTLGDQFVNGQQLGDKWIVNGFEKTSESFAARQNWCYDVKKNSTGWSIDSAHQMFDIMPSGDCSLLSTLVDKRIALGSDMELVTLDLPYDRGKSNHMHGHNKGSKFWKDRFAVFDPGDVAEWGFHVVLDHWCVHLLLISQQRTKVRLIGPQIGT